MILAYVKNYGYLCGRFLTFYAMNKKLLRTILTTVVVCLAAVAIFFVVRAAYNQGKENARTMLQVENALLKEPDTTVVVPPDAIPPVDMQAR